MNGAAIAIRDLKKRFGKVEALSGLTLDVPRGSVCGFLGRNGATALKMLMGMARPDSGSAQVLGLDALSRSGSLEIRRRAAFVTETKELYPNMSVDQTIRFVAGFFPGWDWDLEREYRRRFDLPGDRATPKLSKGMLAKLMLLLAVARGAEMLILDEPTGGLDPAMVEEVLRCLVTLAAERELTIFFSSHHLTEVEQIADHVAIIEGGRAVISAPLDELRESYRSVQVVFEWESERDLRVPGVERIEVRGRTASILVSRNVDGLLAALGKYRPVSVDVRAVGLKEIFLEAVRARV